MDGDQWMDVAVLILSWPKRENVKLNTNPPGINQHRNSQKKKLRAKTFFRCDIEIFSHQLQEFKL